MNNRFFRIFADALSVFFNNTGSNLTSTNVEDAIKELEGNGSLWETSEGEGSLIPKGSDNIASGDYSLAEGNSTSEGDYSHSEGFRTFSVGDNSHTEGRGTTASGSSSHAEGINTTASGDASHAEGGSTTAQADYSHAEGVGTTASGVYSHAEGEGSESIGRGSHAGGSFTKAEGDYSHAEGRSTKAIGVNSHAEGVGSESIGIGSHVGGIGNTSQSFGERVIGTYSTDYTATSSNSFDSSDRAFVVGIGDSDINRKDGVIFNKDGTGLLPSQTIQQYNDNVDGKVIVTKEVLEDAISQGGGDVTASNGLTKDGDNIKLGGELTEFTILDSRESLILRSSETDDGSTPSFSMVINGEETLLSATRPDAGNNLAEISFLNSDFEGTSLQLRTQDDTTNNLCRLDVKGKELSLSSSLNNIQKRAISIDQVNSGILMEDSENQKGLVGAEDYSANYDDNTYVQKKYVDDKTDKGYQEFTFSFQEGVIIGDSIIKILKSDFDGMTVTVERDEVGKYIFTLSQSIFEDEGREGIFTSGMFFSKAVAYPDDTNKIALEIRDRETNSLADGLGQTVIIEARTYNI